jgi:hypothetical protein
MGLSGHHITRVQNGREAQAIAENCSQEERRNGEATVKNSTKKNKWRTKTKQTKNGALH